MPSVEPPLIRILEPHGGGFVWLLGYVEFTVDIQEWVMDKKIDKLISSAPVDLSLKQSR